MCVSAFSLFLFFVCHAATKAELKLKKLPSEDKTFSLAITIKDNAGLGVAQRFEGESHV